MKKKLDEYKLEEIIRLLLLNRKQVILVFFSIMIPMVLIAFLLPKEYESEVKIIPEISTSSKASSVLNQFGVGGLLGFDISSSEGLQPVIYEQILDGVEFAKVALEDSFKVQSGEKVKLYEYLQETANSNLVNKIYKYTIKLPWTIKKKFFEKKVNQYENGAGNDNIHILSKEYYEMIQDLNDRLSVEYDDIKGMILIKVRMPDPVLSANYAQYSFAYLQRYLIEYKTEKAKRNLLFLQERFQEQELQYQQSQVSLALFNNQNINIRDNLAKIKLEKLQNEFDLNFQLYKVLAERVEEAKIQLNERTPQVNVISYPVVPIEPEEPKKIKIILIGFVLALLSSLLLPLLIDYVKQIFKRLEFIYSKSRDFNDQ